MATVAFFLSGHIRSNWPGVGFEASGGEVIIPRLTNNGMTVTGMFIDTGPFFTSPLALAGVVGVPGVPGVVGVADVAAADGVAGFKGVDRVPLVEGLV